MQQLPFGFAAGAAFVLAGAVSAQVPLGKTAPRFTLKTPAGQRLALSAYSGKVVLLDFWGPS